jgi:hypothetical protein
MRVWRVPIRICRWVKEAEGQGLAALDIRLNILAEDFHPRQGVLWAALIAASAAMAAVKAINILSLHVSSAWRQLGLAIVMGGALAVAVGGACNADRHRERHRPLLPFLYQRIVTPYNIPGDSAP